MISSAKVGSSIVRVPNCNQIVTNLKNDTVPQITYGKTHICVTNKGVLPPWTIDELWYLAFVQIVLTSS